MDDTLSRVGSVSGYWDWLFLLPLLPGQTRNRHQCKRKALASCMVVISLHPPPPLLHRKLGFHTCASCCRLPLFSTKT